MGNKSNQDKELKFYQLVLDKKIIVHENGTLYNPKTKKFIARNEQANTVASFSVDGQQFGIIKRRAVWIAFNGPITDPYAKVTFKTDSYSCALDNLKLLSFEEHHKICTVRMAANKREQRANGVKFKGEFLVKLTVEQVIKARQDFKDAPYSLRKKSEELGVSRGTLKAALVGTTFKDVEGALVNPKFKTGGNTRPRVWDANGRPPKPTSYKVKPKVEKPAKVKIVSTPIAKTEIKTPRPENPKTNTTIVKPNLDRVAAIKAAAERMRKKGTI